MKYIFELDLQSLGNENMLACQLLLLSQNGVLELVNDHTENSLRRMNQHTLSYRSDLQKRGDVGILLISLFIYQKIYIIIQKYKFPGA